MAIHSRRGFLAVLAGAFAFQAGCGDFGSMAYFLMPEQRIDAKIRHLACTKKEKKIPKVLILTYTGLEARPQLMGADRDLSGLLGKHLTDLAEAFDEKLTVVPPRKVDEYKNQNPDWRSQDLPSVGKRFDADYVIYLEINELTLFEKGSANTLYRGRASVTMNLVDVGKPDDLVPPETFNCTYPGDGRGPEPVGGDGELIQFRQRFLNHVAKQLSWYFSKYPRRERYMVD